MNLKIQLGRVMLIFFILSLAACSGSASTETADPVLSPLNTEPLDVLDAGEVTARGSYCQEICERQIDAWSRRETEGLSEVYTEDIVHFDGDPDYKGIRKVTRMAQQMYQMFPDWQMAAGETYISQEKCLGTWVNWDLGGFTSDDPGLEFDLLETRENKISFWRLFYDRNFYAAFSGPDPIDYDFLAQFGAAWAEGDIGKISSLYAEDAVLEDTLFEVSTAGRNNITLYIEHFLARGQNPDWALIHPFAEGEAEFPYKKKYPFASQGAIYSIQGTDASGSPCEVLAAVILTPNEEGIILRQETFYAAETLVACGWAE